MGRPKDLPAALQAWALANYAAGPSWGGTPQRAAPGASFLTPGVSLPAEVANYLHGYGFDVAQGALNAVGQSPALNWGPPVALSITPIATAWSDAEQAWYAVAGSSTVVKRSPDFGKTWGSGGSMTAMSTFGDLAIDTSGNICMASGVAVQEGPLVAYGTPIVWTNHAAALGASGGATQIVFEPNSGKWCVIGSITSSNAWVYTSTNRSTWTASTVPGTWTASGFPASVSIGAGNGILVATMVNQTTTQFRTMRSADGGVTWTNDQAIVQNAGISLSIAGGCFTTRPAWSATDQLWYVAVGQTGTRKTQVFSSPDGITWTSAAALLSNDCNFTNIVALDSLLVAVNDDGRIFCSTNKGANWSRCGMTAAPAAPAGIWPGTCTFKAGGGGIMNLTSGNNGIPSMRFGLPTLAA